MKNKRIYGFFQDITEQKKHELELKESEQKLRTLYDYIPVPTYTWKAIGDDFFLYSANDEAKSITKGHVSDYMGITASKMYINSPEIFYDINLCFTEKSSFEKEIEYTIKSTSEHKYFFVKYAFVKPDLFSS